MPKLTPSQRQIKHDRAAILHEVELLRNPETPGPVRRKSVQTISATVLKGTNLTATGETTEMLARLTVGLVGNGSVGLSGIETAIATTAAKVGIPKEDVATIPDKVKQRLDKLV